MSTTLAEVQQRTGALSQMPATSSLGAEAERAIAQVQAAYTIAQRFPRDINESVKKVKEICKVLEVAADAEYVYNRGGKAVRGPNIRIAEIIASQWRNLEYATVEIVRGPGESLCEAYCVDLETNVKARTQFVVPHRRDLSEGGKDLKSDRDIYEMIANMGSRRVREQIFRVIPQFVVDAALEQCRATVKEADKKEPLKDRIKKLVPAFEALDVKPKITVPMLAKWLKCSPDEMIEQQYQELRTIYKTLRDHQQKVEDFFDVDAPAPGVKAGTVQQQPQPDQQDDDKQIPQNGPEKKDEKKPAAAEKSKADTRAEEKAKAPAASSPPPADDGSPTVEEIEAKIDGAKNGDEVAEASSMITGNPNVTKEQGKALLKKAQAKMMEFVE